MSKTFTQRLLHYICLSGFLVACLASCANRPQPTAASTLAIVGGTVVHPQRDAARAVAPNSVIVVTAGRISAVGPADSVPIPAGATVVDARGKWIVPGLIDAHVHFFQSGNLYTRPDAADLRTAVPYAREVARNQARLAATFKVYLASGVTSVVDIGGPFWNFDVRDAAQRSPAAPRVSVAGPLISTVDDPPLDLGDPPIIKITTADEARALVRRELARQPDYIKVWFIYRSDADLPAQEIIVKAAADEAHAAGTPLAVHATQLVVAKAALRAGADYLVHSVDDASVDDEFLRLAIARRIVYCPTLFVVSGYRLALSNTWKPTPAELRLGDPEILAAMDDLNRIPREIIPDRVLKSMANPPSAEPSDFAMKNLRKVWDAGIPVAMGTDAGNIGTLHGPSVFREMSLMQQAGLTPLEVLRSATVYGAKAARHENDVGIIDAGRFADMVLLDADPLIDVMNLSRVYRVIKGGSVFDPDELIRSIR
ncbi:MAG TPA: amidohydrolase family protein [Casimicrobiaceae bacterium]|nr:amidohydrolase family protein [Casimicrobiaceae bacterium]